MTTSIDVNIVVTSLHDDRNRQAEAGAVSLSSLFPIFESVMHSKHLLQSATPARAAPTLPFPDPSSQFRAATSAPSIITPTTVCAGATAAASGVGLSGKAATPAIAAWCTPPTDASYGNGGKCFLRSLPGESTSQKFSGRTSIITFSGCTVRYDVCSIVHDYINTTSGVVAVDHSKNQESTTFSCCRGKKQPHHNNDTTAQHLNTNTAVVGHPTSTTRATIRIYLQALTLTLVRFQLPRLLLEWYHHRNTDCRGGREVAHAWDYLKGNEEDGQLQQRHKQDVDHNDMMTTCVVALCDDDEDDPHLGGDCQRQVYFSDIQRQHILRERQRQQQQQLTLQCPVPASLNHHHHRQTVCTRAVLAADGWPAVIVTHVFPACPIRTIQRYSTSFTTRGVGDDVTRSNTATPLTAHWDDIAAEDVAQCSFLKNCLAGEDPEKGAFFDALLTNHAAAREQRRRESHEEEVDSNAAGCGGVDWWCLVTYEEGRLPSIFEGAVAEMHKRQKIEVQRRENRHFYQPTQQEEQPLHPPPVNSDGGDGSGEPPTSLSTTTQKKTTKKKKTKNDLIKHEEEVQGVVEDAKAKVPRPPRPPPSTIQAVGKEEKDQHQQNEQHQLLFSQLRQRCYCLPLALLFSNKSVRSQRNHCPAIAALSQLHHRVVCSPPSYLEWCGDHQLSSYRSALAAVQDWTDAIECLPSCSWKPEGPMMEADMMEYQVESVSLA